MLSTKKTSGKCGMSIQYAETETNYKGADATGEKNYIEAYTFT